MRCKECGCFIPRERITGLCRSCREKSRRVRYNNRLTEHRKKLIKEQKCVCCGKHVEPIIKIPQRCTECREKHKERYYNKKNQNEKNK